MRSVRQSGCVRLMLADHARLARGGHGFRSDQPIAEPASGCQPLSNGGSGQPVVRARSAIMPASTMAADWATMCGMVRLPAKIPERLTRGLYAIATAIGDLRTFAQDAGGLLPAAGMHDRTSSSKTLTE
jgi:hypothetical protein